MLQLKLHPDKLGDDVEGDGGNGSGDNEGDDADDDEDEYLNDTSLYVHTFGIGPNFEIYRTLSTDIKYTWRENSTMLFSTRTTFISYTYTDCYAIAAFCENLVNKVNRKCSLSTYVVVLNRKANKGSRGEQWDLHIGHKTANYALLPGDCFKTAYLLYREPETRKTANRSQDRSPACFCDMLELTAPVFAY